MPLWMLIFLLLAIYPYLIYPLLLSAICIAKSSRVIGAGSSFSSYEGLPSVSFIVVFHNEEGRLGEKIKNTLSCDYPRDKIEFLFVSDGSNDKSDAVVEECQSLTLIRSGERVGKERAIAMAMARAVGDIFVFSDVGTQVNSSAILRFAEGFRDASCGVISSSDKIEELNLSIEGAFIRLEMFIRTMEMRLSCPVGVSGSLFAARSELARQLNPENCSDLSIAFVCIKSGFRAIVDPEVHGCYRKTQSASSEFSRKRRTVVHGINAVFDNLELLNPVRSGWFAWQLLSHKVMRWLSPVACTVLVAGIFVYLLGFAVGSDLALLASLGVIFIVGFFVLKSLLRGGFFFPIASCLAVYAAIFDVVRGNKHAFWNPTTRHTKKSN